MKIAVVTGASSGMGRQFALQLSGYVKVDELWVIARRTEPLERLKEELDIPVRPISLDLCKEESIAVYRQLLEEEKPDVKLLVNAAGFGKFGDFDAISLEDDLRMIDLNCKSLSSAEQEKTDHGEKRTYPNAYTVFLLINNK